MGCRIGIQWRADQIYGGKFFLAAVDLYNCYKLFAILGSLDMSENLIHYSPLVRSLGMLCKVSFWLVQILVFYTSQ